MKTLRLFLFIFFIQCQTLPEDEFYALIAPRNETTSLLQTDSVLTIDVDSVTSSIINRPVGFFRDKGGHDYVHYSDFRNNLVFLDLRSGTIKKTYFAREGPKATGAFYYSYYLHNLDSIFIRQHMTDLVYLVDWKGEIKSQFQGIDEGSSVMKFFNTNKGSYILSGITPVGNWYEASGSSSPFLQHFDFSHGTALKNLVFPPIYDQTRQKNFEIYGTNAHSLAEAMPYVFSFESSPYLYTYSPDSSENMFIEVKSKYVEHPMEVDAPDMDEDEYDKFLIRSSSYLSVVPDPFRLLYFRVVKLGVNPEDISSISMEIRFPSKYSIMILDSDFNIIGETRLALKTFLPENSFVTEAGLFISENHPENSDVGEDRIQYRLFKIDYNNE